MDLPQDLSSITMGVGWDTDKGEVDLDVSAVLLDHSGAVVETVFFGRLESAEHGITHTGDNLTGEGDNDDEQILVNLNLVGKKIDQIVFVINIYTPEITFEQVANPYCRVVDNVNAAELCNYALADAGMESGLIVSKLKRDAGGRWGFHALGLPCRGRNYKDSLPQIRQICQQDTRKLLVRGETQDLPTATQPRQVELRPGQTLGSSSAGGVQVLVLRSNGSWSAGTIRETHHGGVTVALENGVFNRFLQAWCLRTSNMCARNLSL